MLETPDNRECGIRYKFAPHRRTTRPEWRPELERLLYWCRVFDEEHLAPVEGGASAGNLSFRTSRGFVITPTRSRLKSGMSWESLIEVVRSDWLDFEVHYHGVGAPSSDSFLHERIYAVRPDVNAVFHGHDDAVLGAAEVLAKEFPIALTRGAYVFGTKADAESTARELGSAPYIIRQGHGFLAVGKTLDEAGEWSLLVHRRATEIASQPR